MPGLLGDVGTRSARSSVFTSHLSSWLTALPTQISCVPLPFGNELSYREWLLLDSRTVVISGMPANSTESDLRAVFAQNRYGDIAHICREALGDGDVTACFAVTFFNREDADRAIEELAPKALSDEFALRVNIQPPNDSELASLRALGLLLDNWRNEERLCAGASRSSQPAQATDAASFVSMVQSYAAARQSQSSVVGSDPDSMRASFPDQAPVRASFPEQAALSHASFHQHSVVAASSFSDGLQRSTFPSIERPFCIPEQQYHPDRSRQSQPSIQACAPGAALTRADIGRDDMCAIDDERLNQPWSNYNGVALEEDERRRLDRTTFSGTDHLEQIASNAAVSSTERISTFVPLPTRSSQEQKELCDSHAHPCRERISFVEVHIHQKVNYAGPYERDSRTLLCLRLLNSMAQNTNTSSALRICRHCAVALRSNRLLGAGASKIRNQPVSTKCIVVHPDSAPFVPQRPDGIKLKANIYRACDVQGSWTRQTSQDPSFSSGSLDPSLEETPWMPPAQAHGPPAHLARKSSSSLMIFLL